MQASPEPAGRELLSAHRDRVMYPVALLGVGVLLPFAVNDFIQGHFWLGIAVLAAVLILGTDAFAIHLRKPPPIPYALMLVPMAAGMTLSLRTQGVIGALWSYPTVLFFYFVLPRRLANVCSVTLLLLATYMVYHYVGVQVTIRFVATLVLCVGVVNIILNTIGGLQGQLVSQAITDPLTGVFNRRHLESCLSSAIARHGRTAAPASLLLLDVDCFKQINDQYGHDTGDRVLQGIVGLINRRTRVLDQLFRVGGDEFALLLPDTRESDAAILAEHLRRTVAESPMVDGQPPSVSIGVSELRGGELMDGWMRNADQALYRAKKAGRNQVVCRTSLS